MHKEILLLIIGMTLVTYIPKIIPAVLVDHLSFNKKAMKFLGLIPYTAMAALIFPGILSVDASRPEIGLLGGLAALLLALKKCPVIICVTAAIATDVILYMLF